MARLPEDEIQRRLAIQLELHRMSDEEAMEKWPDLSPDERALRKKKSEIARAKYAVVVDDETGQRLLGGSQPGGGARSRRDIAEAITEAADGPRQREIMDALFSGLSEDESAAVRGKAAERIVNIAEAQREKERRDREELRNLGKEELVDRLLSKVMSSGLGAELARRLAPPPDYDVDATAVDVS